MVVLSNNEETDVMQLWGIITQLGEQLSQNQAMSVALYTTAGKVKNQASNLQSGFVLRKFNLDKSQEDYDAALEQMNSNIAAENLGLLNDNKQLSSLIKEYEQTLETLMSNFRNRAQHVQERELSLIRDFEMRLLAREEEYANAELHTNLIVSDAVSRISSLLRQLLRAQGGEEADSHVPADEAEEREPWTMGQAAEQALEREIELARLEKENEELRRLLGMIPSQPRPDSGEMHAAFDSRRAEHMHQRAGGGAMNTGFPLYQRMHSPG